MIVDFILKKVRGKSFATVIVVIINYNPTMDPLKIKYSIEYDKYAP